MIDYCLLILLTVARQKSSTQPLGLLGHFALELVLEFEMVSGIIKVHVFCT